MVEANPTPTVEDPPLLSNGAAKDGGQEIQEVEVSNRDVNQVNHDGENGTEGEIDEDVNMMDPDDAKKDDFSCANSAGAEDVETADAEHDDNIESVDVEIVCMEYACQKEDKEEEGEHGQDVKEAESEGIKMVEAKTDAGNEEAKENKKEETEVKIEDKINGTNIHAEDDKMAYNEYACQKNDKEGMFDNAQDWMEIEGEDINMVAPKFVATDAEVVENEKKEDREDNTEEKRNEANIQSEDEKMGHEEDAYQKGDREGRSKDVKGAKVEEDMDIKMNETNIVAIETELKENGKEEREDKGQEEDSNIQAEDVKRVGACKKEDQEKQNQDSHDTNEAEGEAIKVTVEAKTIAQNAVVQANKKEGNKDKPVENTTNSQTGDVSIVTKEDACLKEDKERKTTGSQEAQAADSEDLKMVVTKADDLHYGAAEIRNKEENEDTTVEKQKDNNKETISIEKQDEDNMDLMEEDAKEMDNGEEMGAEKQEDSEGGAIDVVDKQEVSEIEQRTMENQDGLKEEVKDVIDKQELNGREQNSVDREEMGSVNNQEVDVREQIVEKLCDEFVEEEKYGTRKNEEVKHGRNEAAEKHEEVRQQDGEAFAKTEVEEQLDGNETVEKKKGDKYDGKVVTDKKEELHQNEDIEKKEEDEGGEKGASEKDEKMETHEESSSERTRTDAQIDDIYMQEGQNKGTKHLYAEKEGEENGSACDKEEGGDAETGQDDESHKNMVENTEEVSKRKKARTAGEKEHGKHSKQDGSKSREVRGLSSGSSHSIDRPMLVRRPVQRLVEVVEESHCNFVVYKGYVL